MASAWARVVVSQEEIDLVRNRTGRVEVRLADRVDRIRPATLKRVVPGASEQLPSSALGTVGGGSVLTDPRDPEGVQAMGKLFHVHLDIQDPPGYVNVGSRVFVRFNHGWEPLARRWYRSVRRLFLSRFNV